MSNFKTGVGTQDIILGLDTAHYSESGMDTAHNTTHYSESGGHRTRKCVQMFKLGWGHRTEFKDIGGGDTTQNQSRLLAVWMAGWLAGLFNVYSVNANPGSILQAVTCQILSQAGNPRWGCVAIGVWGGGQSTNLGGDTAHKLLINPKWVGTPHTNNNTIQSRLLAGWVTE